MAARGGASGVLGEEQPDENLTGAVPDWYVCIQAAKYLGVAPWELVKMPLYWTEWALESRRADSEVEKEEHDRSVARSKAKKK